MYRLALVLVALLLAGRPLAAPAEPLPSGPDWAAAERGRVAVVLAGDSLQLADGRLLRLAGVRAPRAPLDYAAAAAWRREEAARAALARLARPGSEIAFLPAGAGADRYRRLTVRAAVAGRWLEPALLAEGALLLDAEPPEAAVAPLLRAAEAAARAAGRGLWADPAHAPLPAEAAAAALGRFAVVEGRVLAAAAVRGTGYLNFEEDWRSDFTIRLPAAALRALERAGGSLEAFAGRRVRVRGWVFASGGPMIEARHPDQIELLPE